MIQNSIISKNPHKHLSELANQINQSESCYYGRYLGTELYSAYQPIFSLAHKRIVGYEALIRAYDIDQNAIQPSALFESYAIGEAMVFLDRLCRFLHVKNFEYLNDPLNWLFLNISPQIISQAQAYGSFFRDLLQATGFPPHRVVIEIVEHPFPHNPLLKETIDYYKEIGCLIAIDDFGAGHSNFNRIWSLNPEIVKLDRSMILNASSNSKIRRLLPEIISLLHQAGSLVLIEGIETRDQAMIAMECDVDFVQGFYFSKPSTVYKDIENTSPDFDGLFEDFKESHSRYKERITFIRSQYDHVMQAVARDICDNKSLLHASRDLMEKQSAIRCYLLQPDGIQKGQTIVSNYFDDKEDIRFQPIQKADSADWFRRHYLVNAVAHPGQLQITRPYLSITGAHMCITLSLMFPTAKGDRVLCCDLNWP